MRHSTIAELPFFGPPTPDWTIDALLEWIGADDDRCHDERLAGALDAAARAIGAEPLAPGVGVVARVRHLASRVAADAAAGERTSHPVVAGRGVCSPFRTVPAVGALVGA